MNSERVDNDGHSLLGREVAEALDKDKDDDGLMVAQSCIYRDLNKVGLDGYLRYRCGMEGGDLTSSSRIVDSSARTIKISSSLLLDLRISHLSESLKDPTDLRSQSTIQVRLDLCRASP